MLKKEIKTQLANWRQTSEQKTAFKRAMLDALKVWENRKYFKEKTDGKSNNAGN